VAYPHLENRHDRKSRKRTNNLASAPQQERQGGFCLGGSSPSATSQPSMQQAPNPAAGKAGSDAARRGHDRTGHFAVDQRGGRGSDHVATKSPENNRIHPAVMDADGDRPIGIGRLPLISSDLRNDFRGVTNQFGE
jgi:hypothetical protein